MKKWNIQSLSYVSILLVAINVLVFLADEMLWHGALLDAGQSDVYGVILQKEYWRLLTAMFLHSGINHIFNNMLILYFVGAMIEKEVGHLPYTVIYFLSGIGGGVLSLYFRWKMMEPAGSVGASGAIFGLDGLLLAMVLLHKSTMQTVTPRRVILMVALSLYSGFSSSNVDNAGHIGGLLTGFVLGGIYCLIRGAIQKAKTNE